MFCDKLKFKDFVLKVVGIVVEKIVEVMIGKFFL